MKNTGYVKDLHNIFFTTTFVDFWMCFIFQIEFQSNKGVNEQGYVAVDDVSFIEIPKCDLKPKEADPTITTTTKKTTTTTPKKTTPTTTPVPSTEPPDGKSIL